VDLLANLAAARSAGPPAADHAEQTGTPIADCLDTFFAIQTEIPATSVASTASTTLLDQLPPVDVAVRGRALTDLLRPAYQALDANPQNRSRTRPDPGRPAPRAATPYLQ